MACASGRECSILARSTAHAPLHEERRVRPVRLVGVLVQDLQHLGLRQKLAGIGERVPHHHIARKAATHHLALVRGDRHAVDRVVTAHAPRVLQREISVPAVGTRCVPLASPPLVSAPAALTSCHAPGTVRTKRSECLMLRRRETKRSRRSAMRKMQQEIMERIIGWWAGKRANAGATPMPHKKKLILGREKREEIKRGKKG